MAKSNKICYLCGKKYHYCPTCSPDINKPSWYAMWCSEECKNLDQILASHTLKQISIEEAKEKINALKLKDVKFVDDNVEKHYNEIMQSEESKNFNIKNNEEIVEKVNTEINKDNKENKEDKDNKDSKEVISNKVVNATSTSFNTAFKPKQAKKNFAK